MSILLVLVLVFHFKTEVVIKMCFAKKVVLTIFDKSQDVTCNFNLVLEKSF